jgi:acyl carrier protein
MPMTNRIHSQIHSVITELLEDKSISISDETPLIGGGSVLDSMKLVELCLLLEDMASEHGFSFDWTSDSAMSRTRSMFRTAGALAAEFVAQMERSQ